MRFQSLPERPLRFQSVKMSAVGLVRPFSLAAELVVRKLKDEALLKRGRTFPSEECKMQNAK